MKTIKGLPLLMAGLMVVLLASCGPAYVNTGVGYGPRPYYGYGYRPYGGYGYGYRPPVIIRPQPRYYSPSPRYYGGSPNARGGYGGGGYGGGGGRSRGPR